MRKLSSKLVMTQLVFLTVALISIGLTLFVSWKLEGSAAAINDAGSLRMRAYRLAYLISSPQPDGNAETSALVERDILAFDAVYQTLKTGDPARPLLLPKSAALTGQIEALDRAWQAFSAQLRTAGGPERAQVEGFVALVNSFVSTIELDVTGSTKLLRITQLGLILLALAGAGALIYLSFLFVVRPVVLLQEGFERMARADFNVRLPVESRDEFGSLAVGFNTMADKLQGLYVSLESRVAEKTKSLAAQNTRLAMLYDMTTFLNAPHSLEALCRGFVHRVASATGADAGAVRLSAHGEVSASVHFFASEGVPAALVAAEETLRCGECACGDAAAGQRPVVHLLTGHRAAVTLPHCRNAGFKTVAAIPITVQRQTIGIFNLFFREAREVSIEERHVLANLGQHLGVAIENKRLASRERELAVAEERNLLAQELHDSIAQSLAFLNLQVQMLRDALAKDRIDEAENIVTEIGAGVKESYADVRELLTHFRTRVGHQDLEHALRTTLAKFEHQTGIATALTASGTGMPLPADAQLQALHILHEALSNVRKHSGCTLVEVALQRGPAYRLSARDNGRGFDAEDRSPAATEDHLGLRIMQERAARIGATLTVKSRPGHGTEVVLTLPLARHEQEAA